MTTCSCVSLVRCLSPPLLWFNPGAPSPVKRRVWGVGGGKTWTCCRGQCSHRTTHTHTKTWTRLMAQWHTMRRAACEGKILFKKKNTQKLKITYFDSFGERSLFWVKKNTFCFDENTLAHKRTQLANYAPIIHTFLVQYSPPN